MARLKRRIEVELGAIGAVLRNPQLRRLESGWAAISVAEWTFAITLGIYAYDRGGAAAVGVVGLLRVLPGAVTSPFAGIASDRLPAKSVLVFSSLCTAAATGVAAAVAFRSGPLWLVFATAALFAVANSPFLPAESTLMPRLSRSPTELAAGNVAHSIMQNLGFLAASVSVGVILSLGGVGAALVLASASALIGALAVARIDEPPPAGDAESDDSESAQGILADTVHGFRLLLSDPALRLPSAALVLLALIEGAADVLIVLVALDLLGLAESSAGYMNAAWAIASIIGGGVTTMLLARRQMVLGIAIGGAICGAGLALVGAVPAAVAAFAAFALFGLGHPLVEAASHTLMHRLADQESLGRVRGAFESAKLAAMAAGSILVPLLIGAIGIRWSLVAAGSVLPAYLLVRLARLRSLELGAPLDEREYELLRADPIFAPLPIAKVELLCHSIERLEVQAGTAVITEGEAGDRFYIIESGRVEVFEGEELRRSEGPGESFGEIALLHEVSRTATVRAVEKSRLLSLDRSTFLAAVTGHAKSHERARRVAEGRLSGPDS